MVPGNHWVDCSLPGRIADSIEEILMSRRKDRVALVAAATNQWGKRAATFRDLVAEAGKATFDSNPNIKPADIKSFIISTVYPERSAYQGHPAPLAAEWCGVRPSEFHCRVENQCGSGATAIRTAYAAIKSGLTDMVMIVGVEKVLVPSHKEIFLNTIELGSSASRRLTVLLSTRAPL